MCFLLHDEYPSTSCFSGSVGPIGNLFSVSTSDLYSTSNQLIRPLATKMLFVDQLKNKMFCSSADKDLITTPISKDIDWMREHLRSSKNQKNLRPKPKNPETRTERVFITKMNLKYALLEPPKSTGTHQSISSFGLEPWHLKRTPEEVLRVIQVNP